MKIHLTLLTLLAVGLCGCTGRDSERKAPLFLAGNWGVVKYSEEFGVLQDSSLYLICPFENLQDSIYYNGDYTDSYFKADNSRVEIQYSSIDTIKFYFLRQYAVMTNPMRMEVKVNCERDTTDAGELRFQIERTDASDHIYTMLKSEDFTSLLEREQILMFHATNVADSAEAAGSQNYVFTIDTHGFREACRGAGIDLYKEKE